MGRSNAGRSSSGCATGTRCCGACSEKRHPDGGTHLAPRRTPSNLHSKRPRNGSCPPPPPDRRRDALNCSRYARLAHSETAGGRTPCTWCGNSSAGRALAQRNPNRPCLVCGCSDHGKDRGTCRAASDASRTEGAAGSNLLGSLRSSCGEEQRLFKRIWSDTQGFAWGDVI